MEVSKEEEIKQVNVGAPHLVILGAGASYASFPNGDKLGNKLPLMDNLIEVLKLEELIKKTGFSFNTNNFEDIYDIIYQNNQLNYIRNEIENSVFQYFSNMVILDTPTIYDHLLLSLREKDFIATFNWDPF